MAHPTDTVEYTITSRGRPIGTTKLGFIRVHALSRAGWFLPNEGGADAMAVIGEVVPRTIAAVSRRGRADETNKGVRRDFATSTDWADLAEAYHRVHALEFELRRADGSIVPMKSIDIQDTDQTRELFADYDEELIDADRWKRCARVERAYDLALEFEDEAQQLGDLELEPPSFVESLTSEANWTLDDAADLPRYQVFVTLAASDAIP